MPEGNLLQHLAPASNAFQNDGPKHFKAAAKNREIEAEVNLRVVKDGDRVRRPLRFAWFVQAAILLLPWPAAAQVKLGELSTNLSGTIAPGYTATYGNMTSSTHSWALGGAANLSGSYYSPNFLSFNASFYLNQSRANSNFQSISDASGINLSSTIFGGSHFPGSISYTKAYNSEGNYSVPGLANYVTHGNNDTFGITWSENIPDAPSFSAGFQMGHSKYSVYGTNDQGKNAFHSFNLHSGYRWEGFNMGAYYTSGNARSQIPQVVSGQQITEIRSGNGAEGFNATHLLPLHGSISAAYNRSSWNSDYLGLNSNGTINMVNALASIQPVNKFSLSASANYSDNLSGQLLQSVVAAGGVVPGLDSGQTSNSLDLMSIASYSPVANIQTSAFVERRTQDYLGETYGVNSYGGSATYAHELMRGTFNASGTVTENTADKTGTDTLGFSTNENYSSEILGWHVNGSFGYAQNVQTLLVTYMNSYFNYSGNVRRNWGRFNLSAGAGAARTGLTDQPGTVSSSESFSGSFGYGPFINGSGNYSRSSGQALVTGAGLVVVPVPSPTLPSNLLSVFGGDSYSFGLSSTPIKKLLLAAAYSRSSSNTASQNITSNNQNNEFNTLIQYQVRKLNFTSGFSRLEQGFSGSGTTPEVISSYYFGISRWFNFF